MRQRTKPTRDGNNSGVEKQVVTEMAVQRRSAGWWQQ